MSASDFIFHFGESPSTSTCQKEGLHDNALIDDDVILGIVEMNDADAAELQRRAKKNKCLEDISFLS